ncbi:MAG: hypothetical protein AUJ97_04235 [Bacteroidetes bacterium CG2_30_32_10]|nr:MAG: hypothetical protein AUJ97_04235 [Bacteroidetes bacterium CG2_30_32_10]
MNNKLLEINNKYRKYIRRFWITYAVFCGVLLSLFIIISYGIFGSTPTSTFFMPTFEELENPKTNLATEVYSADQVLLGKYYYENRSNIHFSDLAPSVVNALVATEDERFFDHSGIDVRSIFRVLMKNLLGGDRGAGGGSTITQQLAKNLFPREPNPSVFKMVFIKLKEWITAIKLEHNYTKEEILAMYLNTVDFGSQSFGIKSAAKTFFNKTPDKLSIEESAMLIGMLKAPTFYSPARNPDNALKRREVVLFQMAKYGYITQVQYNKLKNSPLNMNEYHIQDQNTGLATYLREYLRMYLNDWCTKNTKPDGTAYNIYKDGLRIYTTINSKMQKYAEDAVTEYLGTSLQPEFYKHWKGVKGAPFDWSLTKKEKDNIMERAMKLSDRYSMLVQLGFNESQITKSFNTPVKMTIFSYKGEKDTIMTPMDSILYYKYFLRTGFMSMETQTGYVRAYVGDINYKYFKYDHVTMSKRQVGSTFKPFLYTLVMQEGEFTPCSEVPNIPVSFDMPDGTKWEPKNAGDAKEGEMVSLSWALANSVNNVSAFLMKRYSPQAVIKIAKKMGITSNIEPVYSICLGTPEISLYEMVGAMNTFANKGLYIEPIFITRIEDKNGNILETFKPKTNEAISEATAYLMINLMRGVVESGTGNRIRSIYKLMNPIAGKTGTTQNNSDGWFMGITPNLVSGVWVGGEDRSIHFRSTLLGQGANMSLPIWAIYMLKVYADKSLGYSPNADFDRPRKGLPADFNCGNYDSKVKPDDIFNNDGYNM